MNLFSVLAVFFELINWKLVCSVNNLKYDNAECHERDWLCIGTANIYRNFAIVEWLNKGALVIGNSIGQDIGSISYDRCRNENIFSKSARQSVCNIGTYRVATFIYHTS